MEAKTSYTLVGIIVLILAAALLSTLLWLSVGFDQKNYKTYIVYITESVHGLSDESPVKFNGVKVGMVSKVELDDTDPQKIKLELKIEAGVPITVGTRATLVTQGITGTTFLGLKAVSPSLAPLEKTGNEPYPVIPYTTSFFSLIEDNFTSISKSLKRMFDPQNAKLIKESLISLQEVSHTIAKNNKNIDKSLQNLPKVITQLEASIRSFGEMTQHVSAASGQFSKTMQVGRDSIDQINQQTLPNTTILLKRLELIAANLEEVSSLMRQNPAVIIRGTAEQPAGPGE